MKKINSSINMVFDFFLLVFSLYFSLWLRFNGDIPPYYIKIFLYSSWLIALVKIFIFHLLKIYKIIVKFMHTYDAVNLLKANIFSTLFFSVIVFIVNLNYFRYPRSVVIIDFILSFFLVSGLRYVEKFYLKTNMTVFKGKHSRALIIGAGEAGSMVLREIRNHPKSGIKVIGYIDDDNKKFSMSIGGKPVLGNREDINNIIEKNKINIVIIAMPSVSQKEINDIVEICEDDEVELKIVPSTYDIISGDVKFEQIRNIRIEDLLGREEIKLDNKEIENYIKNNTVLITGAGGSIGSEISRQTAYFKPKRLILLGKGENSIFNINMEINQKFKKQEAIPVICDIQNHDKVENIFKRYKPDIVFHAAAHKHVYLMELYPEEAFKNNVIGTLNLAENAIKYKVKKFVQISTDKAVRPASIMGMTKRIAEKIIMGLMKSKQVTKFVSVRFGNVLGSRGSVVPIFKEQIASGGPVTVTHPEVKRYFMTIPEAVQLVLEAGGVANGGETFILDMGEPVKIKDLAKRMIRLSGFTPDKDIKIKYIGLKPGEKLFEELVIDDKSVNRTQYEKILVANPDKINIKSFLTQIKRIEKNLYKFKIAELKKIIKKLV